MQNQIPRNWQEVKLGEIVNVYGGGTPSTKMQSYWDGDIPWLTPAELTSHNSRFIDKTASYITFSGLKNSSARLMPENSLLLTSRATIGNISINTVPMATNQGFINIEPKGVDLDYMFYWIKGKRNYLNQIAIGSTFPELSKSVFKEINATIPKDKGEQRKIGIFLSSFDDKIEINNKIAKTLEQMAQAIFKEWFVLKALSNWERSKFETYTRLEYGKALQEGKRISGKILVFGSSGQVGTHNEKLCGGPGIVIGRKGNVGSVFWIDEDFYPIDTTFYVKSKISLYYIYFVLKNMRFHTGDSAVPGLNRESVHTSEILVPDKNTLNKFEKIVTPVFKRLAEIKKENQKLAALRDLLLPKLMKGEITV